MKKKREGKRSDKGINRHLFSRFRRHIRFGASAVYLLFGIFDYLYAPQYFLEWMALRTVWVGLVFLIYFGLCRSRKLRSHMLFFSCAVLVLACWPIVWMIYRTGGHASLYTTGLILCGVTGLQVFRMRRVPALATLAASFLPAVAVIFATAKSDDLPVAIIQSGFLMGMIALSYVYGASEEQVDMSWHRFKRVTQDAIEKMQKTEILKSHFPKVIRDTFERDPSFIMQKRIHPNAVVGFADIVASSRIANEVPLNIDWALKERFLEAATKRAIASEMVVLTHLGDGFLFLANYNEGSQWYYNLITFYEGIISDFRQISMDLFHNVDDFKTGVKFGVSSGPVMVGFLGVNQAYFTAIGPDVNLAARLCSVAEPNQIVVSSRVWHSVQPLLIGWNYTQKMYEGMKGFDYKISATHISPRKAVSGKPVVCQTCNQPVSLIKTPEGFLDYQCPEGHTTPIALTIAA